jgi:hypothetical protein
MRIMLRCPLHSSVHYDAEFETIEDALASENEEEDTLAAVAVFFSVSHVGLSLTRKHTHNTTPPPHHL